MVILDFIWENITVSVPGDNNTFENLFMSLIAILDVCTVQLLSNESKCEVAFSVCSRKTWGIENFVSSTLLRNMREKDLRKAIGFHMKKTQSQHDPKQKSLSVDQARINYLEELSDLKSFGGKSFGATLMVGFFHLKKKKEES